jgi:hypothetical protein
VRWATDLTTQATTRDGVVPIVPVIDCGDRVVLAIDLMRSEEAPAVLRPVEDALAMVFGQYELELRTDHGPQYTGSDAEAHPEGGGVVDAGLGVDLRAGSRDPGVGRSVQQRPPASGAGLTHASSAACAQPELAARASDVIQRTRASLTSLCQLDREEGNR